MKHRCAIIHTYILINRIIYHVCAHSFSAGRREVKGTHPPVPRVWKGTLGRTTKVTKPHCSSQHILCRNEQQKTVSSAWCLLALWVTFQEWLLPRKGFPRRKHQNISTQGCSEILLAPLLPKCSCSQTSEKQRCITGTLYHPQKPPHKIHAQHTPPYN